MKVLPGGGADYSAPDTDAELAETLREVIALLKRAVDLLDPIGGAS